MPSLRGDRVGEIVAGKLAVRKERNLHRCRIAVNLGQQSDHVEPVGRASLTAAPRSRVTGTRPHGRARFPFGHETGVHGRANRVDAENHEGIQLVTDACFKRWCEEDRACGTCLVVVIHDLRVPLAVELASHILGLHQIYHVGITIIVVTNVLVVKSREA